MIYLKMGSESLHEDNKSRKYKEDHEHQNQVLWGSPSRKIISRWMVQHQITYEVQPESTTTVRLLSTGKYKHMMIPLWPVSWKNQFDELHLFQNSKICNFLHVSCQVIFHKVWTLNPHYSIWFLALNSVYFLLINAEVIWIQYRGAEQTQRRLQTIPRLTCISINH
jgi:hypothetical protein